MAMSAERKAELSIKGKERWANSKAIGGRLNRPAERVHSAYGLIVHAGLLTVALNPGATVEELQPVLNLIDGPKAVKVYDEDSDADQARTPVDQIKVAMWLIKKIGSPEQAIKAVKAAAAAVQALENRK